MKTRRRRKQKAQEKEKGYEQLLQGSKGSQECAELVSQLSLPCDITSETPSLRLEPTLLEKSIDWGNG